jgi:hypothetical protein
MSFTTGNDVNILQSTDSSFVGAGAGNDKYILSGSSLSSTQTITITDTEGANTLQLIGGVTIASSKVTNNAIQLILSNGATVNLLGADSFTFEVAGNPLTAVAGTVQNFSQFVNTSLGLSSVPTGSAVVSGVPNVVVNSDGTTTAGGGGIAVAAAGSSDASTAAKVYTVAPGNYTYSISGFGTGDKIDFPATNKVSVENTNYSDGVVDLSWATDGQTVIIRLTGLSSSNDASLNNEADFSALFGVGTIF